MTSKQPNSNARGEFCARLRRHREAANQSLGDIAATTRIPIRSLEQLESGAFEDLPADVFVRGFIRSYAQCVGLDADETLAQYSQLGFAAAPVSSDLAQELIAQLRSDEDPAQQEARPAGRDRRRRRLARGTSVPEEESAPKKSAVEWLSRVVERKPQPEAAPPEELPSEGDEVAATPPPPPTPSERRPRVFLPRDFSVEEDEQGRRGNLTFAVIVLVIVATITMSYLMRRPTHAGDGISQHTPTEAASIV